MKGEQRVYVVFSKAFNTVPHGILIGELRLCEVDAWMASWIGN